MRARRSVAEKTPVVAPDRLTVNDDAQDSPSKPAVIDHAAQSELQNAATSVKEPSRDSYISVTEGYSVFGEP